MPDTATAPEAAAVVAPQGRVRRSLLTGLAALVVLGLAGFGAYWALVGSHYVSTDNAYVGADTALITPLIGGPVATVRVAETQSVKAGDVLVTLDDSDAKLAVTQAQADIAKTEADLTRAKIDLDRRTALASSGAVSADELSAARNQFASATAAKAAAGAKLASAQLALSRTVLVSPIDGVIARKAVQIGQRVEVGAPLMAVVPVTQSYVDANFKEVQLRKVAVGQKVTLTSDLYGDGVKFHGHVTGLAGGTGAAFALIPAQNASGNWIKVTQRVPVRITLDSADLREHPLRIGLSMKATIDTSKVDVPASVSPPVAPPAPAAAPVAAAPVAAPLLAARTVAAPKEAVRAADAATGGAAKSGAPTLAPPKADVPKPLAPLDDPTTGDVRPSIGKLAVPADVAAPAPRTEAATTAGPTIEAAKPEPAKTETPKPDAASIDTAGAGPKSN